MYKELYDIPKYKTWEYIDKVNEGWSTDCKFYIEDNAGNKLLLRICDVSIYDKKRREFEFIKKINSLKFTMSKAIEFGICNNGKNVYMLLSWVEGTSLITALENLSENEQYDIGLQAGRILKEIHSLKVDDIDISVINKKEKILQKLNRYENSTVRIENDQIAIDFIKNNINKNVLAIYVAYSSLYSIAWAEKFGEDEIKGMKKRCMKAFEDYNNFQSIMPYWCTNNYIKYRGV